MRKINFLLSLFVILACGLLFNNGVLAKGLATANGVNVSQNIGSPAFEPAWQHYMQAFDPVRTAIMTGDYKGIKPYLAHIRDALKELRDCEIPPHLRKVMKKVFKYSEALLKLAREGNRGKIQETFDHLKKAVDKLEELRARG